MRLELLSRYAKIFSTYAMGYPLYAPDSVSIIVSNKCNLRCVMCNFWKENEKISNGITLNEFKRLFEDLRSFKVRMVQLTGGEPFLRNDLIDILKNAKGSGLETAIVTNGTLINEDKIFELLTNTDLIYISLDAPSKEQHEKIRGVSGVFEKIINSVELLENTIKDNSFPVRVVLCITITPQAIHEPEEMVRLVKKIGVNGIIYNPASSVYYGNTTLKSIHLENSYSNNSYAEMIDKIFTLMRDPGNMIKSNPFYLAASKEFLKGNERYYKFPCFSGGYNGPLIGFDGTVFPCCAWNVPLGNIKEQPFSRLWKSKLTKQVRKKIKKGECPVCYHHTRTFDFLCRAPFLFNNLKTLLQGYKVMFKELL